MLLVRMGQVLSGHVKKAISAHFPVKTATVFSTVYELTRELAISKQNYENLLVNLIILKLREILISIKTRTFVFLRNWPRLSRVS